MGSGGADSRRRARPSPVGLGPRNNLERSSVPNPFHSPPGSGPIVDGTVKWFNTTKGFGFVALSDGTEAFLHVSALERAGLTAPREGAQIKCEVGPGKKGPQVTRVLEVSGGGAAPAGGGARPSA